jgi:hypothetical protein
VPALTTGPLGVGLLVEAVDVADVPDDIAVDDEAVAVMVMLPPNVEDDVLDDAVVMLLVDVDETTRE